MNPEINYIGKYKPVSPPRGFSHKYGKIHEWLGIPHHSLKENFSFFLSAWKKINKIQISVRFNTEKRNPEI